MVDNGIMATSAQILAKAGANVNATYATADMTNDFVLQAENLINATCTFDFSAAYAGLSAQVKSVLSTAASAWAAMRVINSDVDSIGRASATLRLNVLKDEYTTAINELKSKNTQYFVRGDS